MKRRVRLSFVNEGEGVPKTKALVCPLHLDLRPVLLKDQSFPCSTDIGLPSWQKDYFIGKPYDRRHNLCLIENA